MSFSASQKVLWDASPGMYVYDSYDKVPSTFDVISKNTRFIKCIKLTLAIPMAWTINSNSNSHKYSYVFFDFKQTVSNRLLLLVAQTRPHINYRGTNLHYYLLKNNYDGVITCSFHPMQSIFGQRNATLSLNKCQYSTCKLQNNYTFLGSIIKS